MTHYVVRVGRIIEAPIEVVWDMIADARGFSSWGFMSHSSLEREGTPTPDGVGAVRNLGTGSFISREEVVVFDPPSHLGYVLLGQLIEQVTSKRYEEHITEAIFRPGSPACVAMAESYPEAAPGKPPGAKNPYWI